MLTNCNALSANRLKTVAPEFKKHTQLLVEMKKDLDYIFKKIRAIKTKLSTQYPDAFAEALRSSLAEECREDEDLNENNTNTDNNVNGNVKRKESISSDSDTQIDSNVN